MSTTELAHATPAAATVAGRPGTRMHGVLRITRLHFADRFQVLAVPAIILATMTFLGVVVFLIILGLTPVTREDLAEGFRYNQTAVWSWPGFIVTLGVYAYARTMPYAIGMMGSTRRDYWFGTTLWILVQSAYLSALIGAFLLLERLTGAWFTGARMFEVHVLGNGDLGTALLLSFAIAFACLSVGTTLAAGYLRWGQYGVLIGLAALVLIIIGAIAAVLGSGIDVVAFFATGLFVKIAVLFLIIALVALTVSWFVVRRVPVGR